MNQTSRGKKNIRTVRFGNRLIILDGVSKVSYLDLETKKFHKYQDYEVEVETAIEDWHRGKVRLLKRTFKPDNLTPVMQLHIPISANGKSYIKIALKEASYDQ